MSSALSSTIKDDAITIIIAVAGSSASRRRCLPPFRLQPCGCRRTPHALAKAILFFQGQRSGQLPPDQAVTWRSNSGLSDGSAANVRGPAH